MEYLENYVEKGFILRSKLSESGKLSILLEKDGSGTGYTTKSLLIGINNLFKEFENEQEIIMPDFDNPEFNAFLEKYLQKGYVLENSALGTELTFEFLKDRNYYIGLRLQKEAYESFKLDNKLSNIFPEIISGKSKSDFLDAHFNLQDSFERMKNL